MMFIFRALFWLAVVSAILPARDGSQPRVEMSDVSEAATKAAGAAVDYCVSNPKTCADAAQSLRIPVEFVLSVSGLGESAPQPKVRPSSL